MARRRSGSEVTRPVLIAAAAVARSRDPARHSARSTGLWPQFANAYLCGWLVLISLPLGALPILMALEVADASDAAVAAPLRLLLASLPLLALLFVPLLVDAGGAYAWQGCRQPRCPSFHFQGFGARWFHHDLFALRSVLYLVFWFALSLYFLRPAKPSSNRRSLAVVGLILHGVIGTLAAFDWFMSLDDGHVSANYGVLVIAAQCAFALTAALLILLVAVPGRPERKALLILVAVVGLAAFTQSVEYLVVWSANLPREIVWYQDRAAGGRLFAVAGPTLLAIAALTLASGLATRVIAGSALGVCLLVEFVDLVLLASPNRLFAVNFPADVVTVIALGGCAAACATLLGGRSRQRLTHG